MSENVSPPWTNYEDLKSWFVAHGRNKGQTQEFIEKTLEDDPRINAHHFLVFFAPVQPAYNNDEFERKREEFFEAQLQAGKLKKEMESLPGVSGVLIQWDPKIRGRYGSGVVEFKDGKGRIKRKGKPSGRPERPDVNWIIEKAVDFLKASGIPAMKTYDIVADAFWWLSESPPTEDKETGFVSQASIGSRYRRLRREK